ncbi:DNA cytosine methyltransferase [Shinella curvata]|uniref:DNA (cytosine-5-)-methyltransferase n=1 Tax=Shinella curvata TaxID=1817964 RepID=A0ABT8XJE3_9HYPH|nr:DNA cytosine methyltransferase [Shinella curvata]MCJ8052773.1 DNA cytosine methyltransferase [Shinella curvata]MDO6123853.1 DNA cytosine methyltransferase [Shinella curvata]
MSFFFSGLRVRPIRVLDQGIMIHMAPKGPSPRTEAKTDRLNQAGLIPTLSLFSGAGGLDIGFLQAGFDIRACVEIENSYCDTLEANVGRHNSYGAATKVFRQDIRDFDATKFRGMGIRCVIGGPPCQTFSAAGRRSGGVIGIDDDRGQLFKAYCRILDELQPEVFLFENVYGLPGANGGAAWREIHEAFAQRDYELNWEVIDAADYGVPQHRERLILVGHKRGKFAFPLPTHGPDAKNGKALVSVETAIADLQQENEPYHDNLGGLYGHLLPFVPEGLNYAYFTAEMGHPAPVFAWRSKFHDLLYKVERNAPCRTIKAQPGKFTGPFHWKNRHFTVPELKRLQSFPDNYEIVGSFAKVLEQIGNSVPPRLAYALAVSVREQLLESTQDLTFAVRPANFKSTFRQRQRLRSARFAEVAKEAIATQYPASATHNKPSAVAERESYRLAPKNLFDRTKHAADQKISGERAYSIECSDLGPHIEMEFRGPAKTNRVSIVEISGLRKYLPNYDTLRLTAQVESLVDVFHVWAAVEDALIARSRFFSLIDIYGHYANRGDTVSINADWNLLIDNKSLELLNFFSKTENCGDFHNLKQLQSSVGMNSQQFRDCVSKLREVRFDVRTSRTHAIIGAERTLCTYPFPLLSPRALVESRVQLIDAQTTKDKVAVAS